MILENLTECEQLVMRTVWDAADELGCMEIMERTNDKYHKDWAPQTVSTFLARLVRKGYLRHYRQGRVFLYRILIPLEEYRSQLTNDYVDFWNHGNADEFLCALTQKRPLRTDEIDGIKTIMNGVDERREGESMKRVIETIACDRCGKEIPGEPVRIVPHHVPRSSWPGADRVGTGENGLPPYIQRMMGKDFCEECSAEIVEFALNGNTCDECAAGILDSVNGGIDAESDNPETMPDSEGVDWNTALDRMEQANQQDGSAAEPQETVSDQLGGGGEQRQQAETKETGKQTGRKKLDRGKIMALYRAGWSAAQIAEEMGTSKGTIATTICTIKKGLQGDA